LVRHGLTGQDLERSQRWITLIRLMVYTCLPVMSLGFLWNFQPPSRLLPLIGLVALALLINLGQLLARKLRKSFLKDSIFTWLLDMVMITGIVYYTGGPVSDLWFLYVLVIITGAFARGAKGSFIAAGISSAVYGAMIYLSNQGIIAQILPDPTTQRADWTPTIELKVFLSISFFLLMAAIFGYITEGLRRKSGELEIKTSELDQLKLDTDTILETIPAGIMAYDFSGEILYFNQVGLKILNVPKHIFEHGMKIQSFLKVQPAFFDVLQKMIDSEFLPRSLELNLQTKNSNHRPVGIKATYLSDKEGGKRGVVVYFNDLTEEKALEREIRITDRLSAVGELASDLAHEIRNPLAVIRGSVEFMARELNPGGQMERLMSGVLRESDRLNNLVYEFMDFARLPPPECTIIPARTVLNILQKIPQIANYLDEIQSTSSKVACWADRDQLLRALDSIVREVGRQWSPAAKAQILIADPGKSFQVWKGETIQTPNEQVGFVVRFPGNVLNDSEVDDLFRPFRRADEKHRGLALCTAHRIVMSHNGEIKVLNISEQGLALVVLIPIADFDGETTLYSPKEMPVPEGATA
jgi:two-component system sensor histidine kinase PilS (NtrC family)